MCNRLNEGIDCDENILNYKFEFPALKHKPVAASAAAAEQSRNSSSFEEILHGKKIDACRSRSGIIDRRDSAKSSAIIVEDVASGGTDVGESSAFGREKRIRESVDGGRRG